MTTPEASETQLLPRTHGDFSTVQYWDQFFETRDGDEFDYNCNVDDSNVEFANQGSRRT